jgi:uncharacterized protein YdaT
MLKEILAVSGRPGLYKLVSRGKNLLVMESLIDKKRVPAYPRDKVISLGDISIYTSEGEVSIRKIFDAIKEKENGGRISVDIPKAEPAELSAYFAEIVPDYDRDKVYPNDIKKALKWYDLLIASGITDFSEKEDAEETADAGVGEEKSETEGENEAKAKAAPKKTAPKRKETSLTAAQSAKASKVKSTPKATTVKKSVVGAKRGS